MTRSPTPPSLVAMSRIVQPSIHDLLRDRTATCLSLKQLAVAILPSEEFEGSLQPML